MIGAWQYCKLDKSLHDAPFEVATKFKLLTANKKVKKKLDSNHTVTIYIVLKSMYDQSILPQKPVPCN